MALGIALRMCSLALVLNVLVGWPSSGHAGRASHGVLEKKLAPLIGPADAVLAAAPDGRVLVAIGAQRMLVPASTLKVLTALAALHHLGGEFRYATEFYQSPAGDLIVKGYGDPLLVSERVDRICRHLAAQTRKIADLVLDDSYFNQPILIPGRSRSAEPYDAPNGALCVNFNTVRFERRNGAWISAEPQTPLLPSALAKIEASGLSEGRITLAAERSEMLRYTGELMHYFLTGAGLPVQGTIRFGVADPQRDLMLWRYTSDQQLTDIIAELLAFSNNFIANQLLLTMGARLYGPPADLGKGVQALQAYSQSVLGLKELVLEEGSGISHRNRMAPREMLKVLEAFAPFHALMRREGRQYYKTGTLRDVRARVGYLEAAGGGLYRFVVILNTPGRTTDRIMRVLENELK